MLRRRPPYRDGTAIDIFDDLGVQRRAHAAGSAFEAGWSAEGTVCVHHPRIPDHGDLPTIIGLCPRLAATSGDTCTVERARELGATLFNGSTGR